ncbi:hypothetical protein [Parablautia sp. Marseille-Q6255]|uniref:hypothetical protein n=1 Tax=Parablautia sp. Marseille-Q6255 TaxID=3039593 RepID=UPI0024BD3147|nr:hypothetical protein [Parablautia sp. Marseille-Q6255]
MAKKGIEYVVFGKLDEKAGTYSEGKYFSETAAFNGAPTKSSAKDYGDNRQTEVDNSVTGGTLTWEANKDKDEMYNYLLGHVEAKEAMPEGATSGVVHNSRSEAPFVGVGAVGLSDAGYKTKFYKKVQFSEPTDDNQTKQENTNFGHVTLEGSIFIPEDGVWKEEYTFSTLEAAKKYLDGKVGITPASEASVLSVDTDDAAAAAPKKSAAPKKAAAPKKTEGEKK